MSAPLDREEREALVYLSRSATGQVPWEDIDRYEATVQQAEAQRDRAVAALREIDAAEAYGVRGAIARAALAELEGS